jgi:hypothetical protein
MDMNPTIAPMNPYPESMRNVFERTLAPSIPGNRGPLRFEEGVATDTDVPRDFGQGAYMDTAPSMMRQNHNNPEMFYKYPEQTMAERAHVGSAAWIEAPTVLSEFVQGSMAGDGMPMFEMTYNTGMHMNRPNPTRVDG